jgi:hypothetical protein
MGVRGYRHREIAKSVRPSSVASVAVLGVLASLIVFAMEIALVWLRNSRGLAFAEQGVDIAVAGIGGLLMIWIYWGLWDMLPSAWQLHVFLGLPLAAGFAYVALAAPELAPKIAHHVTTAELELATSIIRVAAIVLGLIQVATFVVTLGAKEAFNIGKPKPLWERVNRL